VTADEAFGQVKKVFPAVVEWDGIHYRYAANNGVVIIEIRKREKFFYWLHFDQACELVHTASESKFRRMKTVGECFSPSLPRAE